METPAQQEYDEAIAADERAESEWFDREQMEAGDSRCPTRQ